MKIFVDRFYTISYWNHVEQHTTQQERDDFKKYMKQKFNIDFVTIFEATPHIEYNIKCETLQNVKNFNLTKPEIDSEFQLFFDGIGYNSNFSHEELDLDIIPDELIEFEKICLNCVNIDNLQNIHKYFNCGYLEIFRILKIKSNVLGLMLMPKETVIELSLTYSDARHSNSVKWLEIIRKHILSNRDILECQEELISNGYKDYAKI